MLAATFKGMKVRDSTQEDAHLFNRLLNNLGGPSLYRAVFGQFNYASLVDFSHLSLIALQTKTSEENCIGYMAINDGVLSTDSDNFEKYVAALNQMLPVTNANTLFINFWIVDDSIDQSVGVNMVSECFAKCPHVDFIIWLCPFGARVAEYTEKIFTQVNVNEGNSELDNIRVLVLHRSKYLPKLMVREALVEDYDDLLPIVSKYNYLPVTDNAQFLSNLIKNQNKSNHMYVGINKTDPVGLIATSTDININLIQKIYDIDIFPDIILPPLTVQRPYPLIVNLVGDLRVLNSEQLSGIFNTIDCIYIDIEALLPIGDITAAATASPEELETASNLSIDKLKSHIRSVLSPLESRNKTPVALILGGFLRTDIEALAIVNDVLLIDHVIEIQNVSDDNEIAEDDDFMHLQLDTLETLRKILANKATSIEWSKSIIDEGVDAGTTLLSAAKNIFKNRINMLRDAEMEALNAPPRVNGFAMTLCCIHHEYSSRIIDLVRVAFEDHPDLEYGFIMLPTTAPPAAITSLMYNVKWRPGMSFDQSMFIVHRNTLLVPHHLTCTRYDSSLTANLSKFVDGIAGDKAEIVALSNESIKDLAIDLKDNPGEVTFLAMIEKEVVSVISITRKTVTNDEVKLLRDSYEVDEMFSYERNRLRNQGVILQWHTNPLFQACNRYFLREIMRRYGKSLLYYQNIETVIPSTPIVGEMVPVRPRRAIEYRGLKVPVRFPLYCISKALLSKPRTKLHHRIVIAGGSSHSYALLDNFCFHPLIYLPNIQFIVENPSDPLLSVACSSSSHNQYYSGKLSKIDPESCTRNDLISFGFQHKISVIDGRLTDIDRENKAIVVSDDAIVQYDLLLLSSAPVDNATRSIPETKLLHPLTCLKKGIFNIGNESIDEAAMKWVSNATGPVVVYGSVLEVLNASGALLAQGIPANKLTLVLSEDELPEIGHTVITSAIEFNLQASALAVHKGFEVSNIELASNGCIEAVKIVKNGAIEENKDNGNTSKAAAVSLPCSSLLCCRKKTCDVDMFSAINDSGLIYDGGIVVDKYFCTVDPSIYALSDYTRYSRVNKKALRHDCLHIRELAKYVADNIMKRFIDPTSSEVQYYLTKGKQSSKDNSPIDNLQFTNARSTLYKLPNSSFLFRSSLPVITDECNVYVTGSAGSDRVCIVKCDYLGTVIELVYLGKSTIEALNLSQLVGLHETYLNFAVYAYENGLVDDWIDFFTEGWTALLYYDKFRAYISSVKESLKADVGVLQVLEEVTDISLKNSDDSNVNVLRKALIGDRCQHVHEATKRVIETFAMDFLKAHKSLLPKFYTVKK
jgi:hypothetical protein